MSRNLGEKKTAWLVLDETGSEGDDDFPSEVEDSDFDAQLRSDKVKRSAKNNHKVSAVDFDEINHEMNTERKNRATGSRNILRERIPNDKRTSKIDDEDEGDVKTESSASVRSRKRKGLVETAVDKKIKTTGRDNRSTVRSESKELETDVRKDSKLSKAKLTTSTKHEIIIDDEEDKEIKSKRSLLAKSRKKKASDDISAVKQTKTVEAISSSNRSSQKSRSNKLNRDKDDDSDYESKHKSTEVTEKSNYWEKICLIDSDKSDHQTGIKDEDVGRRSRATETEERKKRLVRKEDASSESNEHEITIDDEDEACIKVEEKIPVRSSRRKTADDTAATKKFKTVEATSSIQYPSRSNKWNKDSDEDSDSLHKSKPQSSKVTGKSRDELCVIDSDKSDCKTSSKHKNNKGKSRSAGKEERTNSPVRKEERSSESDATSSSKHEITIDDEDEEEIKQEDEIPVTIKTKYSDKICIIHSDESDHKVDSTYRDVGRKSRTTEREERYSDGDTAPASSRHEIPIDDEDPEALKLESSISVKSTKRKLSGERDAVKRIKASSSKEILDDVKDHCQDIKPDSSRPVKTTKKEKSTEAAAKRKTKKVGDSQLKRKVKIDKVGVNVSTEDNKSTRSKNDDSNAKVDGEWSEANFLIEFNQIESQIAENLISLFQNDNTIPFIARYRKEMTGGMGPDELRSVRNTYESIKTIKQRGLAILTAIDKLGKWSPEIYSAVTAAKSLDELELIYAPFKPGSKGTLAERARELGLSSVCEDILMGRAVPTLSSLIDKSKVGLRNEDEIRNGIRHIIADIISKDRSTFEGIRTLRKLAQIKIESTKSKAASSSKASIKVNPRDDLHKFENYFNFSSSEKMMKDYQILAINRGETLKILTVKVIPPDWFQLSLRDHSLRKYNFIRKVSNFHSDILEESFDDAYNRLIKYSVSRQVRHELNERAESASIGVFSKNLKELLLTPPLRGKTILGIDPGYLHGCKLAVISHCGNVLDTATIYPHVQNCNFPPDRDVGLLAHLIKKHNCTIVALGNGSACRETETFLSELIRTGVFAPLDISYTIVDEAGASIYSCSSEARSEFPNMDPNIISAISIARRLQDPLAELVKVDPKHLGIGMYQHDLPQKQLQQTLDEVISETVSFVGVDINTASHCLLRKVAGLNVLKATNIIELRNKCGFILNREQLMKVKGIGKKSYEQCAGFIRILPETVSAGNRSLSKKFPLENLDQTWIHPESYDVAKKFIEACSCDMNQLGTENFIRKVLSFANGRCESLAKQFNTSKTSMDIIIQGLSMKKGEDIRIERDAPLFQKNLKRIDDLFPNTRVTGSVRNVTNFGAFVDIGIGTAGLVHKTNMKGQVLSLGQRVEVIVLDVDKNRCRISLSL